MMEGGRGAAGASDGDEKEAVGAGAPIYADEHEKSGLGVEQARQIQGGRRDASTSTGVEGNGAGQGAS